MRRLYPCRCNNEEGASISFAATTEQYLCCLFVCLLPDCSQFWSKRGAVFFVRKGERCTRRCLMQPLAGSRRRGEMQTKKTKSAAASPLPRLSPRLLTRASTIHPPTIFYTNVSVFSIPTTQILPDLSSDGIIRPGRSSRPERKTFPTDQIF